jgi:hypothetical protein
MNTETNFLSIDKTINKSFDKVYWKNFEDDRNFFSANTDEFDEAITKILEPKCVDAKVTYVGKEWRDKNERRKESEEEDDPSELIVNTLTAMYYSNKVQYKDILEYFNIKYKYSKEEVDRLIEIYCWEND